MSYPLRRTSSSSHTVSCTTTLIEQMRETSNSPLPQDWPRKSPGCLMAREWGASTADKSGGHNSKCILSKDCRSPVSDQNQFCPICRPHKRWTVNMGIYVPVQSGAWSLITGLQWAQSYTYLYLHRVVLLGMFKTTIDIQCTLTQTIFNLSCHSAAFTDQCRGSENIQINL